MTFGRDGMEKLNMNRRAVPSPEPVEGKEVSRLNDYTEVKIGVHAERID